MYKRNFLMAHAHTHTYTYTHAYIHSHKHSTTAWQSNAVFSWSVPTKHMNLYAYISCLTCEINVTHVRPPELSHTTRRNPGTVTIPQYRLNKTKQHTCKVDTNDCVSFFCVLSGIETPLLEAGLECLDCLFCFASLVSRAPEIIFRMAGSFSLDKWNCVRGRSS